MSKRAPIKHDRIGVTGNCGALLNFGLGGVRSEDVKSEPPCEGTETTSHAESDDKLTVDLPSVVSLNLSRLS
jgi:hypothetical protein